MSEFKGTKEMSTDNMKWYSRKGFVYNINPVKMYEYGGGLAGMKPLAMISNAKDFFGENEIEANTRLIVTAPELLESLKEMVSFAEFHGYTNSTEINNARLVISKATEL